MPEHGRPPVSLNINAGDGAKGGPSIKIEFVQPSMKPGDELLEDRPPAKDVTPPVKAAERRDYAAPPIIDAYANPPAAACR